MVLEKNTRYYKINIAHTLFLEYCVERIYGNKTYKRPTGSVIKYFSDEKQAKAHIDKILKDKLKKGYIDIRNVF